jgi:hypothetical protein
LSQIARFLAKAAPVALDDWVKMKNPNAPAVRREAEEDWGKPEVAVKREAEEDWGQAK